MTDERKLTTIKHLSDFHGRCADVRRVLTCVVLAGVVAVLMSACGGPTPTTPTPPVLPPETPPSNNLPVVESITIQGTRPKEPAGFSDVGENVVVTAKVRDDETPVDQLQYSWSAPLGTFTGTGATVTWQAPASVSAPTDVTLTLRVVEKYGSTLQFQHDVTAGATLSLHDSIREVGDMSRQFLLDFSDSSIRDVSSIMRNFQPGCYGTADETAQVTENRRRYQIIESSVGSPSTTVNFGGVCPYQSRRGDACTAVAVFWKSIDHDEHDIVGAVAGTDWLASFYYPDQKRWRLCDSSFEGHLAAHLRAFIR